MGSDYHRERCVVGNGPTGDNHAYIFVCKVSLQDCQSIENKAGCNNVVAGESLIKKMIFKRLFVAMMIKKLYTPWYCFYHRLF